MAEQREDGRLNLVCVDESKHSKRALQWYFDKHHHQNDRVGLVHVFVPPDLPNAFVLETTQISVYHELLNSKAEESKNMIDEFKQYCIGRGTTPTYFVKAVTHSIGRTVCDIAKENKADLIVVGQRGLGKIRRTFLGSVSDYIIHHTHVPIVMVPPEENK